MADLPDEITEEILVRLPASSLLRFKLACKHWQSSISDPNFVGKHLSHVLSLDLDDQSNNNHHKLIIFNSTTASALHSIDYESFNDAATTKQLHIVSASWVLAMAYGSVRMLGFGYDSFIDNYKVIRVTSKTPIEHKVEIYQLKTNSWRRIEGIPYGLLVFPSHTGGTLVNGSLHWASDSVIIGFNLIDEKFKLAAVPQYNDVKPIWGISLVEVRGCLGLYYTHIESRDLEVWILKEDKNENGSWSKLMKIPNEYGMWSKPLCFTRNNEVVLSISEIGCSRDKKLVVYNPEDMTFRNLPACGTSVWSEETIYVETLVSPHSAG
ncbi:hypothetical protein LguiA_001156 [Lonicera macranthoides]